MDKLFEYISVLNVASHYSINQNSQLSDEEKSKLDKVAKVSDALLNLRFVIEFLIKTF